MSGNRAHGHRGKHDSSGSLDDGIFRIYKYGVQIDFDSAKDKLNREKHGLSLAEAQRFEWDTALFLVDDRADYGEIRVLAIGYIGLRLHVLVYTDRGLVRRLISLRKANSREEEKYAKV